MAVLYTQHFAQFFDDNGDPLAGGFLYTYEAGTTNPKATYTAADGLTPNANPIVLDASGRARFFIDGSYKFVLHDSNDAPVSTGTTDNVTSFTATGTDAFASLITDQDPLTTPDGADLLLIYDSSAAQNKKITLVNFVNGQATDSTPEYAADYIMTYDNSAANTKKALISKIAPRPARAAATYATNTNLTTALPIDDTIPQVSEGTEILSVSITPTYSNSKILVRFNGCGGTNAAAQFGGALFVNGAANAVQGVVNTSQGSASPCQLSIEYEYTASSTSAVTFSVRVGPASGFTLRMNGSTAGRYFGGIMAATLTATEVFVV